MLYIVKLKNFTPLHLGTGRESYDFAANDLHSDSLSAALAAVRCLEGKTDDVKEFIDSFTLSSGFPFYKDQLFFPKPIGRTELISVKGVDETHYRKSLKKIKFLETSLWNKLIHGERVEVETDQICGEYITNSPVNQKLYVSQVHQRVSIDADQREEAKPFFFNWTYVNEDAGYFCLLEVPAEKKEEMEHLFNLLGLMGIGTDKNVGGGMFEVEISEYNLPQVKDANATLLLSSYIPEQEELTSLHLNTSRYAITMRSGFMAGSTHEELRHLRKKVVHLFSYGSLFDTTKPLIGKTVNIAPDWNSNVSHPVYRSGKPFYIPIKV